MTENIEPKKAIFAKAKADGKSNREAGLLAGASTTVAADKMAQRLSKDVQVQEMIVKEMERQGITTELIVKPVTNALNSQDIELQLKGHDRAARLLNLGQRESTTINFNIGDNSNARKYIDAD